MKSIATLFCILLTIQLSYCNLYGLWAVGDTAVFGEISTIDGSQTMHLEFPSYTPSNIFGSAENNMTQVFTFILEYPGNSLYLVTVNVAKNKVIYFTPIPSGQYPLGLKYDSDVNSLKATISAGNSSWLVTELDPASASYDVYLQVDGTYLSAGISTFNHTYFVAFQTTNIFLYSFDTRSGDLTQTLALELPTDTIQGPLDMLYIPDLDILVGTFMVQDQSNNVGQDFGIIDVQSGVVKMLGIYQASQQASIVSQAAHQYFIYAVVNINDSLELVTVDLNQQSQSSQVSESVLFSSMGYFSGI
ncbi:hypothetical protein DLAC_02292 [Tieghemostelium lacteum]|uniref:Uncharacterized protein n=1 Tax=Tieghemostelium lacteum TaxID=361077 RepID=A0A152A4L4_TIELA|nr:hypothetical protein DLAC_02292 [Tieghemostelium lacteum]|eukprot:KYR01182.1 hypothetical protein DLAC_02292 [Tieghemostelium lacteum]